VDLNAQQYQLTGAAIIHKDCCMVLVEGGPRGIKKFTRLMMHRIDWKATVVPHTRSGAAAGAGADGNGGGDTAMDTNGNGNGDGDGGDGDGDVVETAEEAAERERAAAANACQLVWQGSVAKSFFKEFRTRRWCDCSCSCDC
jgi:U4/U6 small nuclear ribonucleoprotein PRP3